MDKCTCLDCTACKGTGNVWFSDRGVYLGRSRNDDMDTLETCEDCNGTGIFDECEYCREIREQEDEDYYLSN